MSRTNQVTQAAMSRTFVIQSGRDDSPNPGRDGTYTVKLPASSWWALSQLGTPNSLGITSNGSPCPPFRSWTCTPAVWTISSVNVAFAVVVIVPTP